MRILLSAYACQPNVGSEPEIGWQWARHLGTRHDVTVFTTVHHRQIIEHYRSAVQAEVVYVGLPLGLDQLLQVQHEGIGRRLHYWLWQRAAGRTARKLNRQKSFDIVHHVSYIQYLTWAFGFNLDIPFVFGPIGGAETVPRALFRDLSWRTHLKEWMRVLAASVAHWFCSKRPGVYYIFSNPSTQTALIRGRPGIGSTLIPAVYLDEADLQAEGDTHTSFSQEARVPSSKLNLIMAGRLLDWKGPLLALHAVARARDRGADVRLLVIGSGPMAHVLEKIRGQLALEDCVTLTSAISRKEFLRRLNECDAVFYPAFRDSGSMLVAESYLNSKPVIMFDIDSQFYVGAEYSIKVSVATTYEQTVDNVVSAIVAAATGKADLPAMGRRGRQMLLQTLSWNTKLKDIERIYQELSATIQSRRTETVPDNAEHAL